MAVWKSIQTEYVPPFSKEPIDNDIYLYLSAGFYVDGEDENEIYFLKLKNNLYGTRQAAENWFAMLQTGLGYEGLRQNKVDPCLFVRNNCFVIFYVDDCCKFSKDKEKIYTLFKNPSKKFNMTDDGDIKSYLGNNISKYLNGTITMS